MSRQPGPCRWGTETDPCTARVWWLLSEASGAVAPIDVEPSERGNIVVDLVGGTYRVVGRESERADLRESGVDLHLNHHVTCPAMFRSRVRRGAGGPPEEQR